MNDLQRLDRDDRALRQIDEDMLHRAGEVDQPDPWNPPQLWPETNPDYACYPAHARPMTRSEFLAYAAWEMSTGSEGLFERIAEIGSEMAMFGDSGPGSVYRLRPDVAAYNGMVSRYESLTGRKGIPRAYIPNPPARWSDHDER